MKMNDAPERNSDRLLTDRPFTGRLLGGRLLTAREAGEFLAISSRAVAQLQHDGLLPVVRPTPGTVRFCLEDLRAYVESRREPAVTAAPRS